jgi:N-acetylmuramoyl-L-alanine amidase CwlA
MLYDYIVRDYIDVNPFSRVGTQRVKTTKIVMHYTANPGASDEGHKIYFNSLKDQNPNDNTPDRYASAHIFVDKDSATEIIPLGEVAYHASQANTYSIGIEMCQEKDGSFHPDMLKRTIKIVGELCKLYGLHPTLDVIRHYDVTGKLCPKPWVDTPSLFWDFKSDVLDYVNGDGDMKLDDNVTDYILAVLSYYWGLMDDYEDIQDYTHLVANKLRVAVGREEE